ncbi:hypothetical protein HJG60_007784 [Phyllostomus discolor]|uniref:Uncharacterized protein n=1 Tax=Phyllostomus discolor TaxID=89673 RepID=A0A834EVG7_9CHIR|nr:hypothetical protein HJG60_007784 [Phyllostomus discolor]
MKKLQLSPWSSSIPGPYPPILVSSCLSNIFFYSKEDTSKQAVLPHLTKTRNTKMRRGYQLDSAFCWDSSETSQEAVATALVWGCARSMLPSTPVGGASQVWTQVFQALALAKDLSWPSPCLKMFNGFQGTRGVIFLRCGQSQQPPYSPFLPTPHPPPPPPKNVAKRRKS